VQRLFPSRRRSGERAERASCGASSAERGGRKKKGESRIAVHVEAQPRVVRSDGGRGPRSFDGIPVVRRIALGVRLCGIGCGRVVGPNFRALLTERPEGFRLAIRYWLGTHPRVRMTELHATTVGLDLAPPELPLLKLWTSLLAVHARRSRARPSHRLHALRRRAAVAEAVRESSVEREMRRG